MRSMQVQGDRVVWLSDVVVEAEDAACMSNLLNVPKFRQAAASMSKKSSTLRSKVKPRSLKKIMNLQDVSKRPSDSDDPIRDEVSDALRTRVADALRESVMQAVQSQRAAVGASPLDDLTACAAAISAYASVLFADSVFMVLLRDPDTEELILVLPGLASNWSAGVADKLSVLRFHAAHGLIPTILDRLGNCCSLRFFPLGCLLSCRDWILADSGEETSDDPTDGHGPAYQLMSSSGRRKRSAFTAQAPSSVGADARAHLESFSDCRGEPCAELLIAEMLHVNGSAMVQRATHSSPVSCLFPSVSNTGARTIPNHAPLVCVPIKAGEQLEGFAMVAHVATRECPAGASSEEHDRFAEEQRRYYYACGLLLKAVVGQVSPVISLLRHQKGIARSLARSRIALAFHRFVCKDLSDDDRTLQRLLFLMLQVSNAEHGALFAVDRVAGEIICFLGHERCVGLRLELDHSLFRKSYETQRPQSYNSPTVDCHHLNLDYDTRSGIESRFCCVVPFANSAGTVEALAILVNRHNSRLPMTIHDFSRSLSCLSPDRGHWVGNDRMFDLRKVLPHVGRGANYYSRQEEFVLGALAKETSKSGGSSVLSRLSLSAIWRSEQQTSGTSFLSHVFPEAPKTSRPSTGYRTYRHSIMTDPDNYMDDLTRMEQHRKATFKDVETLGTPRLAAFAANAVLVSSSLDGLRSFSSASMPVEMEQTPNLGSSPQSTSPLLHRRLTFDFERLKPVVGEFDVDWWALNTQDMYVIFSFIMADVGCLSNFTITPDLLQKFFLANAAGYHISNPYHNFFHAMQTTHCAYLFLTKFNLIDYLSDIHTLSLLLAALSHDINHPGVNNGMLISMRHPISDLYNDLSCLEMHHAAYVWRNILSKKQTNVLVNLSTDDFKLFRKNHVNAILNTDMNFHPKRLSYFNERLHRHTTGVEVFSVDDAELIVEFALHCADISNPVLPHPYNTYWATLMTSEFHRQVNVERGLGLTLSSFMMTYDEKSRTLSQLRFLEDVTMPLFRSLAELSAEARVLVKNGEENALQWKAALAKLKVAKFDKPNVPSSVGAVPPGMTSSFAFDWKAVREKSDLPDLVCRNLEEWPVDPKVAAVATASAFARAEACKAAT